MHKLQHILFQLILLYYFYKYSKLENLKFRFFLNLIFYKNFYIVVYHNILMKLVSANSTEKTANPSENSKYSQIIIN